MTKCTYTANSAVKDPGSAQAPTTVFGLYRYWGNQVTQGCYFHDLERGINTLPGGIEVVFLIKWFMWMTAILTRLSVPLYLCRKIRVNRPLLLQDVHSTGYHVVSDVTLNRIIRIRTSGHVMVYRDMLLTGKIYTR